MNRNISWILTYTHSTTNPQICFVLTPSTNISQNSPINTILNSTYATFHVATRSFQYPYLLLHTFTHTYLPNYLYVSIVSQFILSDPCENIHLCTYIIPCTYFQTSTYVTEQTKNLTHAEIRPSISRRRYTNRAIVSAGCSRHVNNLNFKISTHFAAFFFHVDIYIVVVTKQHVDKCL